MKIKTSQQLKTFRGEDLKDEHNQPITLGIIAQQALLTPMDQQETGETKFRRWKLAERLEEKEAEITTEEAAQIKQCVGKAYPPAIVGPFYEAIEKCGSSN